jgi:N-acetyl-1-D-myo-inositol-2-amino-2-deoxy-alpha-D-glucopyranoside deacetylase
MLLVHAHPDDETITTGATMARYVAKGVAVTLVTCTLGEEGEILVPELAGLAADAADQLGGYRIVELERACAALGVTDHRYLGGTGRYRDSGMMGLATNNAPRAFWQADLGEAARLLADIVREVRPQVVVTYDERGGYGHPDHIQSHRVAMAAVDVAADPAYRGAPWEVAKVYWAAVPRSLLAEGIAALRAEGRNFDLPATPDDLGIGVPDEVITTELDGTAFFDAKQAAMRAHATQISVDGPFFALSNNLGQPLLSVEHFTLVRGLRGADSGTDSGLEKDLFAGLDDQSA